MREERSAKFSHLLDFGIPVHNTASDYFEVFFLNSLSGYIYASASDGRLFRIDGKVLAFSNYIHISDCISEFKGDKGIQELSAMLGIYAESMNFEYYIARVLKCETVGDFPSDSGFNFGFRDEHARIPLYYTRPDFILGTKNFDLLKARHPLVSRTTQASLRIAHVFAGFALCTPDEFVEADWGDRLDVAITRAAEMTAPQSTEQVASMKGRPPEKREAAIVAFLSLYPEGTGDESLKEIARKVSDAIGRTLSTDTMRRAIRQAKSEG